MDYNIKVNVYPTFYCDLCGNYETRVVELKSNIQDNGTEFSFDICDNCLCSLQYDLLNGVKTQ